MAGCGGWATSPAGSSRDDLPCYALFEERSSLIPDGEPEALDFSLADFGRVCREFGLATE